MRRGAALPSVLLALGLVAALVVGGAFITRRWAANESDRVREANPDAAAEAALVAGLSGLDSTFLESLPERATAALGVVTSAPAGQSLRRVWITRLDPVTCLITTDVVTSSNTILQNRLGVAIDCLDAPVRPLHGRPWTLLP